MLFKFTVQAKKGSSIKQIEKLEAKLSDTARLNTVVGKGFEKALQRHFRALNRRPNKRGWRRIGFWNDIAKSVTFTGVDNNGATVAVQEGRKFAAKVFGARITPKGGKKFLAIPAIESRYGMSPSSLDKNELTFRKTRKGGLLGVIRADGTMDVHYWLVRSATTPRDADALPKMSDISTDIKKSISKYLGTQK